MKNQINFKIIGLIFSVLFIFCNVNQALGQYYLGPVSLAQGGSGRATSSGIEGPLMNPATLPFFKEYTFGGHYTSRSDFGNPGNQKAYTFIDNDGNAVLPASLSFLSKKESLDSEGLNQVETNMWHLAMARNFSETFSFGFYLSSQSQKGPSVRDTGSHINGGWGILWVLAEDLGVALVSYNVRNDYSPNLLPVTALGMNYVYLTDFRLRFDVLHQEISNPNQNFIYALGFESHFKNQSSFRMGYRKDDLVGKAWGTLGVGWDGPKLGIDYGYEKNFSRADDYAHSIDLRVYF